MNIKLEFEYLLGQTWPKLQFIDSVISVQRRSLSEYVDIVTYEINCQHSKLEFANVNKKETDTVVEHGHIVRDQVVKLKKIWVQDILLDLNLLLKHSEFAPDYHPGYLEYCKQNQITAEEKISTYDFYFNGNFIMRYALPFWHWYAEIRKQHNQQYFTSDQIELYIGNSSDKNTELLSKLKKMVTHV